MQGILIKRIESVNVLLGCNTNRHRVLQNHANLKVLDHVGAPRKATQ